MYKSRKFMLYFIAKRLNDLHLITILSSFNLKYLKSSSVCKFNLQKDIRVFYIHFLKFLELLQF